MTDHPQNDQFHASSFLQGANAGYVEQMYARFAADPQAVDATWAAFFRSLGDSERDVRKEAAGASWSRPDWPPAPADDLTAAMTGEWPADARATADNADVAFLHAEWEQVRARALSSELRFNRVNRYRWPLAAAMLCFAAEAVWLALIPVIRARRLRAAGRLAQHG